MQVSPNNERKRAGSSAAGSTSSWRAAPTLPGRRSPCARQVSHCHAWRIALDVPFCFAFHMNAWPDTSRTDFVALAIGGWRGGCWRQRSLQWRRWLPLAGGAGHLPGSSHTCARARVALSRTPRILNWMWPPAFARAGVGARARDRSGEGAHQFWHPSSSFHRNFTSYHQHKRRTRAGLGLSRRRLHPLSVRTQELPVQ